MLLGTQRQIAARAGDWEVSSADSSGVWPMECSGRNATLQRNINYGI